MDNKNVVITIAGILAIIGAITVGHGFATSVSITDTETCIDCDIDSIDNDYNEITEIEETTTKHRHAPPATKPPRKCWYWLGVKWCV